MSIRTVAPRPGTEPRRMPSNAGPPRGALPLAVIAVAQLMIVLDASVVIVALPSAQHALHISVADRQWVMTSYTLVFGTLLLLGGRIADYLGRRRMFVVGLLGFAGASALGGLAQGPAMLFAARALQGAFAAAMAPASLSLLTTTFTEPAERARAFGVYGAVAGSGAAIGLVLGGALTQFASWRWTLLINVPIALLAAAGARRFLQESRGPARRGYDLSGAVAVTAAFFFLVYGFTTAGTDGWSAPVTVGLLAASLAGLVAFVLVELRSANPLLPIRIILDRNRGGSFLVSLLVGCAMLGTFLFLTYYFQGSLGYSAVKTGFAFLPFSFGIIAGATLASRLLPRTGPRALMVSGLILGAAGLGVLTQLHVGSSYVGLVLPAEIVASFGMGMSFVPMSSTALIGVDPADAGVASALVNGTQQIGSSLGPALLNTVAASASAAFVLAHPSLANVAPAAQVHGYATGFTVSAAFVVAAAAVAATVVRAKRSDAPDRQGAGAGGGEGDVVMPVLVGGELQAG
ncbi:MAG: MFS transporter [Acidimicrobiales bacterium]